ncbi:uncharacterized protein LOC126877416 [Bombus huntii]|uniref:uncharacterized protein LOC126877416 n=1 Tax=Bombus huntii TaxID=85661 RepID=UPI0021AADDF2|nr:uncharacterized protein LOC126877416 [Bombus huntii]
MAPDYNLTYHSYFVEEDECREGVSARTVRSGGTAAASAAAATAPEPALATTATTTTCHATHGRAAQYQHYHHHHHHRHVSMSPPPLLLSSPAPIAATHNHLNVSGHRNVVTPPDTPADRSPPSPGNKLNRSQHLPREAASVLVFRLPHWI